MWRNALRKKREAEPADPPQSGTGKGALSFSPSEGGQKEKKEKAEERLGEKRKGKRPGSRSPPSRSGKCQVTLPPERRGKKKKKETQQVPKKKKKEKGPTWCAALREAKAKATRLFLLL